MLKLLLWTKGVEWVKVLNAFVVPMFCLFFFFLAFMKPLWRAINCSAANLSASLAPQFIPWRRYPIQAVPSNDQWLMFYRDKTENKTQRLLSNKVCLQLWPAWSAKSSTSWHRGLQNWTNSTWHWILPPSLSMPRQQVSEPHCTNANLDDFNRASPGFEVTCWTKWDQVCCGLISRWCALRFQFCI